MPLADHTERSSTLTIYWTNFQTSSTATVSSKFTRNWSLSRFCYTPNATLHALWNISIQKTHRPNARRSKRARADGKDTEVLKLVRNQDKNYHSIRPVSHGLFTAILLWGVWTDAVGAALKSRLKKHHYTALNRPKTVTEKNTLHLMQWLLDSRRSFTQYHLNDRQQRQDSWAIAKKTARCARYMGALKSFESPHYAPDYFSRNL